MTERYLTCDLIDERLPDFLDGALPPAEHAAVEAHVATCLRCTALVRDLTDIEARAQALPELRPARDLWDGIAARIEAPVVELRDARGARVPAAGGRVGARWTRVGGMVAAAAALIAVTAGVTRELTLRGVATPAVATAAPIVVTKYDTVFVPQPAPGTVASTATSTEAARTTLASTTVDQASVADLPPSPYDREIGKLHTLVRQRRGELDPATVVVLEQNLRIIDDAIAQSRQALAQDPASSFLQQQLEDALGRKLELLRTVAVLPASTEEQ